MYGPGQPALAVALTFRGIAVYVFNTVPDSPGGAMTLTNLNFTLDQACAGNFTHVPNRTVFISYHVPVFTKTSLADTQHTLDMRATGPDASLVLFDYALYSSTTGNPTSASPAATRRKRAEIIGGVLTGVVGGCVAVALLIFICRRRHRKLCGEKREGDLIQQSGAGIAHVPVLPGTADELCPRPYPPSPDSNVTSDSRSRGTAMARADAKACSASGTGNSTGADTPSHPASNMPTVSETGRSDSNVREDLTAIRKEIAKLREQQSVQEDSLPPPYETAERGQEQFETEYTSSSSERRRMRTLCL